MKPSKIPGTSRQRLTSKDGSSIERSYVYLPSSVWAQLHEMARSSGTSVSKIIQSFANTGAANSKESNANPTTNSPTAT